MLSNHLLPIRNAIQGAAQKARQNAGQNLRHASLPSIAASNCAQCGFMLIEVMVAIIVLSLGLLGLAALQAVSLKTNANAHLRSQAVFLASDMLDRVRANHGNLSSYALAMNATPGTGSSVAITDLNAWLSNIADTMPNGDGAVVISGRTITVTVQWTERALRGEGNSVYQYQLSTTLPG